MGFGCIFFKDITWPKTIGMPVADLWCHCRRCCCCCCYRYALVLRERCRRPVSAVHGLIIKSKIFYNNNNIIVSFIRRYWLFLACLYRMWQDVCEQRRSAKWHVPGSGVHQHLRRVQSVRVYFRGRLAPEGLRLVHRVQAPKHTSRVRRSFWTLNSPTISFVIKYTM